MYYDPINIFSQLDVRTGKNPQIVKIYERIIWLGHDRYAFLTTLANHEYKREIQEKVALIKASIRDGKQLISGHPNNS
jgi:hypothetical protein